VIDLLIIHVEDCFLPSAGYQINALTKWNRKHGHDVVIITTDSIKPWKNEGFVTGYDLLREDRVFESENDVKIFRYKSLGRLFSREVFPKKLFKNELLAQADLIVVHGNDTLTGIRFSFLLKKYEKRLVFDNHMIEEASINRYRGIFRYAYKRFISGKLIRHAIPVIAVSEETKSFVMKQYNLPDYLVPVIPLGTDGTMFEYNPVRRKTMRERLNIGEDETVFVYTGKISRSKKIHLLAEAFIEPFTQPTTLLLVGSGEGEYDNYVSGIFNLSKNRIIRIVTKPYNELPGYYNAADIAIWPGACSLSFFDAQMSELPVVLEDIPINKERLRYNNGFLYNTNSSLDLRKVIESVNKTSKSKIREYGKNGRMVVEKDFDYDGIARQFENVWHN